MAADSVTGPIPEGPLREALDRYQEWESMAAATPPPLGYLPDDNWLAEHNRLAHVVARAALDSIPGGTEEAPECPPICAQQAAAQLLGPLRPDATRCVHGVRRTRDDLWPAASEAPGVEPADDPPPAEDQPVLDIMAALEESIAAAKAERKRREAERAAAAALRGERP